MAACLGTIAIVVPTRNRAELAINTIESVLQQDAPDVRVVVSENSTDESSNWRLREYCAAKAPLGVHYTRPKQPLPMAENWNFGLETALAFEDVTHAMILTDRMLMKPGEFRALVAAVRDHPDRVLIFTEDRAYDDRSPVELVQTRWTGTLVEVSAERLLYNASIMHLHPAPRIMNCVVPREVFEAVRSRFGTITGSVSPDYAFAYRCLFVVDALYYFDRAIVIYYAWPRSNGRSFARGEHTADSVDFLKSLAPLSRFNGYAPIPELITVVNSIVNEYCLVQQLTGSAKFPAMNRDHYLLANEDEIRTEMRNPQLRDELLSLLSSHPAYSRRRTLFRFIQRLLILPNAQLLRPFWKVLADHTRLFPPGDGPVVLQNAREAIDYVARRPRRRHLSVAHLRVLLGRTRTVGRYAQRHVPQTWSPGVRVNEQY